MLLIGKNVKYAQSGGTADAALTPDLLDAGSIGIYAVDPANDKQKLVIVGASGTGKVTATNFKGKVLQICQGLGSGKFKVSELLDIGGIQSIKGSKYAANTGFTAYVGYNGTDGSMGIQPFTGYQNEVTLGVKERKIGSAAEELKRYYSINATEGMTAAQIVDALVLKINNPSFGMEQQFTASKEGVLMAAPLNLMANGSTTGGTLVADEYFFKMVAIDAAGGSTVGSVEDSVVTTGSTSSIAVTSDTVEGAKRYRLYVGLTTDTYASGYLESATPAFTYTGQALTAGTIATTGTAITRDAGLKLVALDLTKDYTLNIQGLIENATITYDRPSIGSGTPAFLAHLEKEDSVYRGDFYTASTFFSHLASTVDTTKTYDMYVIKTINVGADKTGMKATVDHAVGAPYDAVWVGFEVQGNVLGTNQQADFEDILIALFPDTQEISA